MKTASAKAKGRALQNTVRDMILHGNPDLTSYEVKCALMGESGADIKLGSSRARLAFPYAVECKNQEKLNLWSAWSQCVQNAESEGLSPLLVIKRNKVSPLAIVDLDLFFQLLAG